MKLRGKLLLNVTIPTLLGSLFIAFIFFQMIQMQLTKENDVERMFKVQQLNSELIAVQLSLNNYAFNRSEANASDALMHLSLASKYLEDVKQSIDSKKYNISTIESKYIILNNNAILSIQNGDTTETKTLATRTFGVLNDVYLLIHELSFENRMMLNELSQQLKWAIISTFLGGFFVVIISGIYSWITTNRIVTPVKLLVKQSQEISGGNLEIDFQISKRKDEIGELSRSFAKMVTKLEYLAYHDYLTELPNRTILNNMLEMYLEEAKFKSEMVGVIFLDLDRFKVINDSLGHDMGDLVLKTISKRLQDALPNHAFLARFGGDEFIIIIKNIDNYEAIESIAKLCVSLVAAPLTINQRALIVQASIGVSVYPFDGSEQATLIRNADTAMYKAKKAGKNQIIFYDQQMNVDAKQELFIEQELRIAIKQNQLQLHYQPQLDIHTGKIIGSEALLRWNHPSMGIIPPDQFIPIAEETGLITSIGEWVLKEACQQNKQWREKGLNPGRVAVNLSANQLHQNNFIEVVEKALDKTELDPQCLELEVTETVMLYDVNEIVDKMRVIKKMGIKLSIDDFGTEYSSLSYVKYLPVDQLKIDRSFINNILLDNIDTAIVKAVITLAKSCELEVIAEGVEDEQQYSFLKDQGCDMIQGYYYSKPLPPDDFEKLLIGIKADRPSVS